MHGHHNPEFQVMATCCLLLRPLAAAGSWRQGPAQGHTAGDRDPRGPGGKGQPFSPQEGLQNWGYPSGTISLPPAADWKNNTAPGKTGSRSPDTPEQHLRCSEPLARSTATAVSRASCLGGDSQPQGGVGQATGAVPSHRPLGHPGRPAGL